MTERIRTVDFAKGISAFMIVMLHAMFCQPSLASETVSSNVFVDLLYTALFLFFIFSGYFYRPERSSGDNIKKRLIQLTLVSSVLLLVLPAVLLVYFLMLGLPVGINDYLETLWLLIGGDNVFDSVDSNIGGGHVCGVYPGYYFIQVMIVSCILFYPTVNRVLRSWKTMLIGLLIMLSSTAVLVGIVGLKLPFYAQLAPFGTAFMYIGAFVRKYDLFGYIDRGFKERRYWLIFFAALVSSVVLLLVLPPGHAFDSNYFGEYGGLSVYPYFITVVPCCYVLMVMFSLLVRIPVISDVVCCFGKHTLAILLLHAFVIKLLVVPFFGVSSNSWFPALPFWVSIAAGIIGATTPVILMILLSKYRIKCNSAAQADSSSFE